MAPYQNDDLSFFYFHLMSVHRLGTRADSLVRYETTDTEINGMNETIARTTDHYDNGVFQADHIVRGIISTLERKGYLDDAIVLITADHGESLGENGIFSHGRGGININEVNVPVLIYGADNEKIANKHYATHVDIAPTLLRLTGIHPPSDWHGISLTQPFIPRVTYHYALDDQAILYTDSAACYKYTRNDTTNKESIRLFHTFDEDLHDADKIFNNSAILHQLKKLADRDFK